MVAHESGPSYGPQPDVERMPLTRDRPPALGPSLPLAEWEDTYATLRMMTEVVGKLRLALCAHGQPPVAGTSLRDSARALHGTS